MKGRFHGVLPILTLALMIALPDSSVATTRYVAHSSFETSNTAPYETPSTASTSIGAALAVSSAGDTVLVAGIAADNYAMLGYIYGENLIVPDGLVLMGGWDASLALSGGGDETNFDSLWTVVTPIDGRIISFEYDSTVASVETTTVDESLVFDTTWAFTGPGPSTLVQGLILNRGALDEGNGAGVLIRYGSPRIEYNVLVDNLTPNQGGAIFIGDGSPAIVHNTIANGFADEDAGVVHVAGGSPVIRDNIFFNTFLGYGLVCSDSAAPSEVSHNVFFGNGGKDNSGCDLVGTNYFGENPVFCDDAALDYRIFQESPIRFLASDGTAPGAWSFGCRAGTKYVSVLSGGNIFPYSNPENAARTIGDALAIASPGDTILVAVGVYSENLELFPGLVILGGYDLSFSQDQPDPFLSGTIVRATDPDLPVIRVAGGSGDVSGGYFILDQIDGNTGSAIEVHEGSLSFEHLTVAACTNNELDGGLIHVSSGAAASIDYSLFSANIGGPVIGCEPGASISLTECNFFDNTRNIADDCPATVVDSTHEDPFFCDLAGADYHLYSESPIVGAGPGGLPIGALAIGCNFSYHYIVPGSREGVYPYESPEHATSNIVAAFAVASGADTVRFSEGNYETNLFIESGLVLQGGWDSTFSNWDPTPGRSVLSGSDPGNPTVHFTSPSPALVPIGGLSGFTVTHGAGITGPGIAISVTARPFISGNLIVANTVDRDETPEFRAAGIDAQGSDGGIVVPRVWHNTIVENTLLNPGADSTASGMFVQGHDADESAIERNIFAFNQGGQAGLTVNHRDRTAVSNVAWANLDSIGVERNFAGRGVRNNQNTEEDPDFCDTMAGDWQISTCSPAADRSFSASGDTVAGAFPIACICPNNVWCVNAIAAAPAFPYRATRTCSKDISTLTPLLSAGDTVKVATNPVTDAFELVPGVIYRGGYDDRTFSEATRLSIRHSRVGSRLEATVVTGGDGVDSSTVLDGFAFSSGFADSGAAIHLTGDASPVFTDNFIQESRAEIIGGAILAEDSAAPTFERNVIHRNSVGTSGGGIIHLSGGSAKLINNTISNNSGGGWAIVIDSCAPVIYNNSITYNDKGVLARGGAGTEYDHNNTFRHSTDCDLDFAPCAPDSGADSSNISVVPEYCGRGLGIYTIFDHSPLIGSGRDGATMGALRVNCNTPIHYVSSLGTNTFPYSTPTTAALTITDALAAAAMAGEAYLDSVDELRVAEGVYNEDLDFPTNVRMSGGWGLDFGGSGSDSDERPTVITGTGESTVVTIAEGALNRTPRSGKRESTRLTGFTIQGGSGVDGGGVHIGRDGQPILRNLMISDNSAERGGAIFSGAGSRPWVEFNLVIDNEANLGAGVFIDTVASASQARYRQNTFYGNSSSDTSGIIHTNQGIAYIQENVVAFSGSGAAYTSVNESPARVDRNLFFANPGGDSLLSTSVGNPTHVIADPQFCDPEGGDFGLLYDRAIITTGESPLRDSCATEWWGKLGAGCAEPGHRFFVKPPSGNDEPIFPYACKENASPTVVEVLEVSNPGDTIEVAGDRPGARSYRANWVIDKPLIIRGGWDNDFSLVPDTAKADSTAPNSNLLNTKTLILPSDNGPLVTVRPNERAETDSAWIMTAENTIIEGFEFKEGVARTKNGGGVRVFGGASLTLQDNVFNENLTLNWGGGISIVDADSPVIRRNYITRNEAGIGGAIYLYRVKDALVQQNIIAGNKADEYGGIRLEELVGGDISNNVFYQNAAGGVSLSDPTGDVSITNNVIAANGGVGVSLAPYFDGIRTPRLSHNSVWANSSGNYLNLATGEGDISQDPQFCNTDRRMNTLSGRVDPNFYRYQECSAMLNSGSDPTDDLGAHIGVALASDFICADTTEPELSVGFYPDHLVSGLAALTVVPSEALARDSVDLSLIYVGFVDTTGNGETDTLTLDTVSVQLTEVAGGRSIFHSENIEIQSADSLIVVARAADRCGVIGEGRRLFSAERFKRGAAGVLRATDGRALLKAETGVIAAGGLGLMEVQKGSGEGPVEGFPFGNVYEVQIEQLELSHPLTLEVSYGQPGSEIDDLRKIVVARKSGDGVWTTLSSTIDPSRQVVSTTITSGGTFSLVRSKDAVSEETLPKKVVLHGNSPNPFNPVTAIAFDIPAPGNVVLAVYDIAGREVRTLHRGLVDAGRHTVVWDGKNEEGLEVGSGVYFYRLLAGSDSKTRKMVLVR